MHEGQDEATAHDQTREEGDGWEVYGGQAAKTTFRPWVKALRRALVKALSTLVKALSPL